MRVDTMRSWVIDTLDCALDSGEVFLPNLSESDIIELQGMANKQEYDVRIEEQGNLKYNLSIRRENA
jgi:hypothetical protein